MCLEIWSNTIIDISVERVQGYDRIESLSSCFYQGSIAPYSPTESQGSIAPYSPTESQVSSASYASMWSMSRNELKDVVILEAIRKISGVAKNYLKDNKHNSLHLTLKIFLLIFYCSSFTTCACV